MKRLLLSCSLFVIFANTVMAEEIHGNVSKLTWDMFCPQNMLYAQPEKIKFFDGWDERFLKEEYNYWSKRKIDFINQSNNCNDNTCIYNITEAQNVENAKHSQELQLKIAKNQDELRFSAALNQMNTAMKQQQNYNNYINAINAPKNYNVNVHSW